MFERKFDVLGEDGEVLASNLTFDMAITFLYGYHDRYFNEKMKLTIRERLLGDD